MKNSQKFYQEQLYDSKQIYARIVDQLPVHPTQPMKTRHGFKLAFALVAVTALALTLGFQLKKPVAPIAYAVVSVDINPSFELTTAKDGTVLEIEAINDDAKSLDTSDLIGTAVEKAVEEIILSATAAGFIQADDTTDDYVIVSTVVLDENDPEADTEQDDLDDRITEALEDSDDIEDTTVVTLIKATLREKFEADEKEIPLGLYIINGMIEVDGEMVSVKEFVSNSDNLEKLEKKAERLIYKQTRFTEIINRYIAILTENSVDTTAYAARLSAEGEDLEALKDELEALVERYDTDDTIDGDSDASDVNDKDDLDDDNENKGQGNKGKPSDKLKDDEDTDTIDEDTPDDSKPEDGDVDENDEDADEEANG